MGGYGKLSFKLGKTCWELTNGQKMYDYVVCPCPRAIHKDLYEGIQVYTRSEVSVYRTIGPLVLVVTENMCCHRSVS